MYIHSMQCSTGRDHNNKQTKKMLLDYSTIGYSNIVSLLFCKSQDNLTGLTKKCESKDPYKHIPKNTSAKLAFG